MPNDDLVAVMVPRVHLSQVYGFIASLESGADAPSADVSVPVVEESASDEWTASRLRRMIHESPPAMKEILRTLAEHPNEWLTTNQLADALQTEDADWMTVAGTMGAFGRRLKNRYGIESFPFDKRYSHEARSKIYRMSQRMAAVILSQLQEA